MVTKVLSGMVRGIESFPVYVETDISNGMPTFDLVGYLSSEVKEARERVRTALNNSGISLPLSHITANLSPANLRKSGTGFDLPIALSILICMGTVPEKSLENTFVAGEMMLSGEITSTRGILPMLIMAKSQGVKRALIPQDNIEEGSIVEGIDVFGVSSIEEVIAFLKGEKSLEKIRSVLYERLNMKKYYENDFSQIKGQALAKRGAEIAAAGLHNILLTGPPGAGKSLISKCIPSILPPLSEEECLEVSTIYSVKGALDKENPLITTRPFIAAHHTSTDIALIGGGGIPRPGAVSLAHKGVLFLDEIPEFSRNALEALRQPLEDKVVNITRSRDVCIFPSDFMLVAAMNPCPCGHFPDRNKCNCTESAREKYMAKISGPLLDRIDICITVEKVPLTEIINRGSSTRESELDTYENRYGLHNANANRKTELNNAIKAKNGLHNTRHIEASEDIRKRVVAARYIQENRFKGTDIGFNSQMNNFQIEKFCEIGGKEARLLEQLSAKYNISARSYYRILRVSRTIADLSGEERIREEHLLEAARLKLNYK